MTLSYNDTLNLIKFVLICTKKTARKDLNMKLKQKTWTEPEFYAGVREHGLRMPFTADQWFDFHSKIPDRLLRDHAGLMSKLSPQQRNNLPR